eukprot:5645350-Alexandrium_andersonii.AAC.1
MARAAPAPPQNGPRTAPGRPRTAQNCREPTLGHTFRMLSESQNRGGIAVLIAAAIAAAATAAVALN